jgi:hypothetical protein
MSDKDAQELDDTAEPDASAEASEGDDDDNKEIEIDDSDELADLDEEEDGKIQAVEEELSQKDQNARSLAIRRALEQRMEQKRLHEDLNYLDLDLED